MLQQQAAGDLGVVPPPDPWSGWAQVVDLPASVEHDLEDEKVEAAVDPMDPVDAAGPAAPDAEAASPGGVDMAAAVAQLLAELADERSRRVGAEEARREAETRVHAAEVEAARLTAEVAAAHSRVLQLERDRDDVIRRAEELLTAVRERADQRRAAELEAAHSHWSELLAEERRRVEALDRERAALTKSLADAWLAGAVLRRTRPLRLRSSAPGPVSAASAEEEVLEILDEHETDAALAAESPQLAEEIEKLRQRLRAQLHKPPNMPTVEDGVDRLRESRLARDAKSEGRRPKK
jgi:hypothetical protein